MSTKEVPRFPTNASAVKKGSFIILKSRPCKISEVKTSKTGKHGHAKSNITGSCVLTNQKCQEVYPAHTGLTEFKLDKVEYMVCDAEPTTVPGQYKISCLDSDNENIDFYSNPASEFCKGKDLVAAMQANPDITYAITILRAPVEIGENEFKDEELMESFKEYRE